MSPNVLQIGTLSLAGMVTTALFVVPMVGDKLPRRETGDPRRNQEEARADHSDDDNDDADDHHSHDDDADHPGAPAAEAS